jgi:hypothetical protein
MNTKQIDTLTSENNQLRGLLVAICKASESVYFVYKNGERTTVERRVCAICGKQVIGKSLHHYDDCPVAVAQRTLKKT